jgi:hypothetical protein
MSRTGPSSTAPTGWTRWRPVPAARLWPPRADAANAPGCGSWPPTARSVHGRPPGTGRKDEILGLPGPAAGRGRSSPGPTPAGWPLTWQGLPRRRARRSRSSSLATRCSTALTSAGPRQVHQHREDAAVPKTRARQPDVRAGSVRTCGGSHRRAGAARQRQEPARAQGAGQRRIRGWDVRGADHQGVQRRGDGRIQHCERGHVLRSAPTRSPATRGEDFTRGSASTGPPSGPAGMYCRRASRRSPSAGGKGESARRRA